MRRIGLALLALAALSASAVPAWSEDPANQAPTASLAVAPQSVVAGEGVVLDGSGSRDADGTVVSYAFDLDGDGSYERGAGAESRLAHVFDTAGSHQVGLRVVDAAGASADASATVTVAEPAPEPEPEPEPAPQPAAEPEPEQAAEPEPKAAAEPKRTRAASEPDRDAAASDEEPAREKPKAQRVQAAASTTVSIEDFSFAPRTVSVNAGDTVTWRNNGEEPHTATGSGFDTGTLRSGQSGSATFRQAGTFSYKCTPHPFMTGTVRVAGSGGGSGGSGGSGGGTQGAQNDGGAGGTGAAGTGEGSASSGGDSLPSTGLALGSFVVPGLALIAIGALLRRRAAWPAA